MTNRYGSSSSRLLVLTGSAEVSAIHGRRTALEHFDGPEFRIVRKYLADCSPIVAEGLHILILTAGGFVGAYERVAADMAPIDDDQADELAGDKRSAKTLHDALDGSDSVFLVCSAAIEDGLGCLMMSRPAGAVDWLRSETARGSDARKLNGLLQWLVRTTPTTNARETMLKDAALSIECASDGPMSIRAQALADGYLVELAKCRDELNARRALTSVN